MPTPADGSTDQASAAAVRKALRELTANLMRITRGTGKPALVLSQTNAVAASFSAYRSTCGADLSDEEVTEALRLEPVPDDDFDEVWPDWDRAVRDMVNGALQVAAAELLSQQAQAATGRRELFAGYRHIEKLHTRQLRRLLRRRIGDADNENDVGDDDSGGGG